jgi:RHS repeat-associated protein
VVEFASGKGHWIYVSGATNLTVPARAPQDYHYDSQGRRQGSIVIYDGENQIAKYDDAGTLLVSYLQGPGIDNPISATRDGQTYYYHTDTLGSVTELTDSSGLVVQSYRYDAFGAIVQRCGSVENPFTYTGRELDEGTGLYYYRARYYDAELGRFISRDPLEGREKYLSVPYFGGGLYFTKRDFLNPYRYVFNNPALSVDPTGYGPPGECPSYSACCAIPCYLFGDWGWANCVRNCLLASYTCFQPIEKTNKEHFSCYCACAACSLL